MITPEAIRTKALRQYPAVLSAWLRGEAFTPLEFPVGALPTDFAVLRAAVQQLQAAARQGYQITMTERDSRRWGRQSLPERVIIPSVDNYLHLTNKTEEFAAFCADTALIRDRLPALELWLRAHPREVIAQHGDWDALLKVCAYRMEHPEAAVTLRELPVPIPTKFIETHTGILNQLLTALLDADKVQAEAGNFAERFGFQQESPQVRIRFLDNQFQRRLLHRSTILACRCRTGPRSISARQQWSSLKTKHLSSACRRCRKC